MYSHRILGQGAVDGYLKGKGNLDVATSFSGNSAERFLGSSGNVYDLKYKGSLLSLFAELGLSDNFDLVAVGAVVFTPSLSGFQDGAIYAKYRLGIWEVKKGYRLHVISALGASFPLSNYKPTANGALGTKAITVQPRFILQLETPPGFFVNLTGGYNWRLDEPSKADILEVQNTRPDFQPGSPSNFTTYMVKFGFPAAHYYLDTWFEWQTTNGGSNYVPDLTDLPQLYGVSYKQVGGTAYYSDSGKNGFYLSAGYILGGRNVSQIFRITGGYVFKLTSGSKKA